MTILQANVQFWIKHTIDLTDMTGSVSTQPAALSIA